MARLRSFPFAAMLLTACSPDASPPAPAEKTAAAPSPTAATNPAVPEGSTAITAAGDLVGEYRVAGIDGEALGGDLGIAVSVDGQMLSYEPTCLGFVWTIGEAGGELTFKRTPGYGPTRQPDGAIMSCAVAVPEEFTRLGKAIDAARRAWRTPSNGMLLEGGGRSVLLFSQ